MASQGKNTFVIFLLIVCSFSWSNGYEGAANLINPHFKVRKLASSFDAMLDYHEATPNPAHDPGKGRSPVGKGSNYP